MCKASEDDIVPQLVVSIGLVFATCVLAYFTYKLKRSTDHLAKATIIPRLAYVGSETESVRGV